MRLEGGLGRSFCVEARLLVCAARVRLDAEEMLRIRELLKSKLDWHHLLALASAHRMKPLLYHHLQASCTDLVPAEILKRMAADFRHNTARNLFLGKQLLNVLEGLEARGVHALAYKGPALAETVYGNLSLREFVDLDILVQLKDIDRAQDVLASLGYKQDRELSEAQHCSFLHYHCEYQFKHERHDTLLELQWGIAPRFFSLPIRYEELWERPGTATILDKQIRTLAPEDLLLILCIHGSKHLWERLEWICGVRETLGCYKELDWEHVFRRASEWRAQRMLSLGLLLAHEILEADLPAHVLQSIKADTAVAALASDVCRNLFQQDDGQSHEVHTTLFHLKSREHWQDRFRYCYRLAFTSTEGDWVVWPLLPPVSVLYYPVRAVRLAKKYLPGMLKTFLTRKAIEPQ